MENLKIGKESWLEPDSNQQSIWQSVLKAEPPAIMTVLIILRRLSFCQFLCRTFLMRCLFRHMYSTFRQKNDLVIKTALNVMLSRPAVVPTTMECSP